MVRLLVVDFEVLCGRCAGGILILRQRSLSKQCLFRFLCFDFKIFNVCAAKRFKDCNTKLGHAKLLFLSTVEVQWLEH